MNNSPAMSSPKVVDLITIHALYWEAIASFQQLFHFFDNSTEDVPDTLADDFGRLKVWAENVGAHRRGNLGLDHRLREASSVKESAKSLLKDLNDVLEESK
jgi:hypothetical protein